MADEQRRIRQTLEDVQGRARQLERAAGRHLDRIADLEAQLQTLKAALDRVVAERDEARQKLADSERAFSHVVARLESRGAGTKDLLRRIRELEARVAQQGRDLARAEARIPRRPHG